MLPSEVADSGADAVDGPLLKRFQEKKKPLNISTQQRPNSHVISIDLPEGGLNRVSTSLFA